ncbi:MAG: 5'-nucleotidase C-terminal domain-containing protein, partial [Bacilli bacterium]|nr:5'-nucleotidase C-terminal domain-containing protein [Bacilli bacterium]
IVESEGYKVGIIGVRGYGLVSSIAADKVEGYEFLDPVPIVENLALKLRSEHLCDLVIAATHNYSSYFNLNVTNFLEASFVDAIVCAHTHQRINESEIRLDGYEVPIIQSNDKNQTAGEIIFKFNKSGKLLSAKARHYYPDRYQADSKVLALIESYAADIAAGERIIGYTVEKLYRDRLGLEITKAMKNKYQVDVAFINTGGVRETLSPGPITVKDVYQVFPFDNAVILTDISGSQLRSLYYNQRSYLYYNDDFDFDAIESDTIYRIAIIDYIYYRSYYTMYFEEYEPEFTSNLMRDVFIEYLEEYYPL